MSASVSAHLEQHHGVKIAPGRKGVCPFCRHECFSVRKDDSIGKCFHPTCGRFITSGSLESGYDGSLYQILDKLKQECHAELLAQKGESNGWSYDYLTNKRGIHEELIADLGELGVVPHGYDVDKLFAPQLENIQARRKELETKIQESQQRRLQSKGEGEQQKKKATPSAKGKTETEKAWEKGIQILDKQEAYLLEQREELRQRLPKVAGWIAFFHTDAHHRVLSIRFRKYEGKHFQSYVPFKGGRTGLFGHGLFSPYQSERRKSNNRLMLVEGEFNLLQMHSLAIRTAEAKEDKSSKSYANWIAATGSATTLDIGTITALLKTPGAVKPLVLIQDHDDAGEGMKTNLANTFALEIVLPPKAGQDIDDHIRDFGASHAKAWQGLSELIRNRVRICRPYEAVAKQIYHCRQKQGEEDTRREFEIHAQVTNIVITDLKERGKFYHEHSQGFYFNETEKRLIPLDNRDNQLSCSLERYGLNPVEKACEYVEQALHIESLARGAQTRIHRLAWYDSNEHTLYLFNHADQIYRITADAIELVDNGTDGVLFLSDPRNEPFQLVTEEDLGDLFHELVTKEINYDENDRLTDAQRQLLFDHWFYSLFFGSIMPTRPILAFIGPKGSGKSYTLKRVGMLLFGGGFQVKNLPASEGDFDAIITNVYYAGFDNADSKVAWLPDRLAVCATGGMVSKRALYTTNQLVDFPIDCFLGITSRTPRFNRDDVADRLLIHNVKRFEEGQFKSENELKEEILRERNRTMTAVVRHLQECLAALQKTEDRSYRTSFRMADFATFCLRLADVQGRRAEMDNIFALMQDVQVAFTLDGDTLIDLLELWLKVQGMDGQGRTIYLNQGREVTAKTLHGELSALAGAKGLKFDYLNGRSLGQRLHHIESNLRTFFDVTTDSSSGQNQKTYTFAPLAKMKKTQAQAPESESPGIARNGDSGSANYLRERC